MSRAGGTMPLAAFSSGVALARREERRERIARRRADLAQEAGDPRSGRDQ